MRKSSRLSQASLDRLWYSQQPRVGKQALARSRSDLEQVNRLLIILLVSGVVLSIIDRPPEIKGSGTIADGRFAVCMLYPGIASSAFCRPEFATLKRRLAEQKVLAICAMSRECGGCVGFVQGAATHKQGVQFVVKGADE